MDTKSMPPQHVIDEVRRQGGSIWLAHPHWSSVNILRDTLPLNGLAGVEVFNTTCRCAGRGESSVHWDDWMDLLGRPIPALANDDSHALESDNRDTYQGWNMVKVRERSAKAIIDALEKGCAYVSTGPEIHDIQLRRVDDRGEGAGWSKHPFGARRHRASWRFLTLTERNTGKATGGHSSRPR